jgi:hypothetical protein
MRVILILVVIFVFFMFIRSLKNKRTLSDDELLSFFVQGERMTVYKLATKIESSRKGVVTPWNSDLSGQLDALVAGHRLCKESKQIVSETEGSPGTSVIEYFLPPLSLGDRV